MNASSNSWVRHAEYNAVFSIKNHHGFPSSECNLSTNEFHISWGISQIQSERLCWSVRKLKQPGRTRTTSKTDSLHSQVWKVNDWNSTVHGSVLSDTSGQTNWHSNICQCPDTCLRKETSTQTQASSRSHFGLETLKETQFVRPNSFFCQKHYFVVHVCRSFHVGAVDVKTLTSINNRIFTSMSKFNMTPNWWVWKNGPGHSLTSSRKVAISVRKCWCRHQHENPLWSAIEIFWVCAEMQSKSMYSQIYCQNMFLKLHQNVLLCLKNPWERQSQMRVIRLWRNLYSCQVQELEGSVSGVEVLVQHDPTRKVVKRLVQRQTPWKLVLRAGPALYSYEYTAQDFKGLVWRTAQFSERGFTHRQGGVRFFDAQASNLTWRPMESIPGLASKCWRRVICVKTLRVFNWERG